MTHDPPTVLLADHDPFDLRLLQELCESAGYVVVTAGSGGEVLDTLARQRPDLLVLDAALADIDGLEVLRRLKADPTLTRLAVVVVTDEAAADQRDEALRLGAEDYITRPYRMVEVQQRIRNALRLVHASRATDRHDSHVDSLTHAGTPTQLGVSLEYELTRAQRYDHPLTVVVVRVQGLDALERAAGQDAADGVRAQVASGLRTCIRAIDHLFRSGQDELTVLLPETGADGAAHVLARIQRAAADQTLWGVAVSPAPRVQVAAASHPNDQARTGEDLRKVALGRLR